MYIIMSYYSFAQRSELKTRGMNTISHANGKQRIRCSEFITRVCHFHQALSGLGAATDRATWPVGIVRVEDCGLRTSEARSSVAEAAHVPVASIGMAYVEVLS